jgi:hypothetical protein
MFLIIKNKDPKLCCAYRCKNRRQKRDRFCSKHRKRYKKETNPEAYHFDILRSNAKRRGKDFKLTLEEFKLFCEDTSYLKLKGRSAKSASIDRIDPEKGYEYGNIQVLTLAENSAKRHIDTPF